MKTGTTRFTLDLDIRFQKRLKVMAALKGVSMRQYCIDAIDEQLLEDELGGSTERVPLGETLDRLAELRAKIFKGRVLPDDSVKILRELRGYRDESQ